MIKVSNEEKSALIESVICKLELKGFKHEASLIKNKDDLTKQYKKAQYYMREFATLFEETDEISNTKACNLVITSEEDNVEKIKSESSQNIDCIKPAKGKITQSVDESNDELLDEINKKILDEIYSLDLINRSIGFGISCINREVIEKCGIIPVNIGMKDGYDVCYCREIDNFICVR